MPALKQKFDYAKLFPFIKQPSRYIGGEWNSITKPEAFKQNAVGLCLCFPDLYETGFANMGVEILYRLINERGNAYAERAYAADSDLADLLRRDQLPFFSLESQTPLAEFDLVGFSLPYELCFNNVLEMLDLAQIPIHAAKRTQAHPIVIGGGPCAVNPEPLADFFDAFVIGDGEPIIGAILDAVHGYKFGHKNRAQLLRELARLKGVYVPSLYEVSYHVDGQIERIQPKFSDVPQQVAYSKTELSVEKGADFLFPIAPVVPFVQTVHDRLNVEIQRGCPWRCRFCQAGFTYNTYRERTQKELVGIVEEGLRRTGYDSITLAGLSAADHSEIVGLLQSLSDRLSPRRIAIGLPSTRADRFTLSLAEILQTVRRQSLTFAPEAGSERLRRVIRKELQETEIRETLRMAAQHGWKNVKLYFMYGLPTETQEDLQGIVDVVRACRRDNPSLSLALTLSPFVPKPHTPYQWHQQDRYELLQEKLSFLRKNLPAKIRAHDLGQIAVEGVLARGDRRCSKILETVWKNGGKFDEWGERFNFELWKSAFTEHNLTPEFFAYRTRGQNEVFPWDHLQGGPNKRALWLDYQTALKQAQEPVPAAPHLKARPEVPVSDWKSGLKAQEQIDLTVQRLRFKMRRVGAVRFLSHLEQIEMARRVLRRALVPVCYSAGFHPQMKCSFGPAVSVGYESDCEYFDVDLSNRLELDEVQREVAAQMPRGFELLKVSRIPLVFPSLESLINQVQYQVTVPAKFVSEQSETLRQFLNQPEIILKKFKKSVSGLKTVEINLKSFILKMQWQEGLPQELDPVMDLLLRVGPGKSVKPEKVVGLVLNLCEDDIKLLQVRRKAFYIEKPDGSVVEP